MKLHLGIYLVFFTLLSSYSYGPLPGAKNPNVDMFTKPQPNKEIIENFLLTIPEHYAVAATNNLGSHISQRQKISTVPLGTEKADFVLFLFSDNQKEIVSKVKSDKSYIEVFQKDNFIVFKKRGILL